MKGTFFITFMIFTSCVCVLASFLWDYTFRSGHRKALILGTLGLTLLSVAGFSHYEEAFPGLILSGWDGLYDGRSMAALVWLLAFFWPCPASSSSPWLRRSIVFGTARRNRPLRG